MTEFEVQVVENLAGIRDEVDILSWIVLIVGAGLVSVIFGVSLKDRD